MRSAPAGGDGHAPEKALCRQRAAHVADVAAQRFVVAAEDEPAAGDDLAREQRRRVVEHDEVDVVATEGAAERAGDLEPELEPGPAVAGVSPVQQYRDVSLSRWAWPRALLPKRNAATTSGREANGSAGRVAAALTR